MAKRNKSTKGSRNGQNSLMVFFAIVIVLAIISIIIAFYYQDEFSDKENNVKNDDTEQQLENAAIIEGTWVSNYDGKMLTIKGLNIILESPSVEGTEKISGKISFENNIVTFVNATGSCKEIEGHYLYSINDDGEIFFKLIKDSCSGRIERNTMTWFKL